MAEGAAGDGEGGAGETSQAYFASQGHRRGAQPRVPIDLKHFESCFEEHHGIPEVPKEP